MGAAEVVVVLAFFAPAITKTVDLLRNAFDATGEAPKWTWNVVAFGLGIGLAFVFDVNVLSDFAKTGVGEVLGTTWTGLALGGTASGFHELFDLFSTSAKR